MPVNRNALIRYRTIDNCLRNRYRQWTLEDLIDSCSEALYEFEGIEKGVSKRTVQMDIQLMRSEKLGYNAPIVVVDKKYYTYEDPDYSITNIPLTDQDLGKLTEVADILRQFKGFTHFQELTGMVQRLEDKIHTSKSDKKPIINLEKNENLRGLEYIDPLYQAILNKQCVNLTYKSFRAKAPQSFVLHPYLLKEYRNRWFVLGKRDGFGQYSLFALDRIVDITESFVSLKEVPYKEIENYFEYVIGVTVNSGSAPEIVRLFISNTNAPYVLTKPMHHSQQLVERTEHGIIISLFVQHNFELEREILGFGETASVISPPRLRNRIIERLKRASSFYESDNEKEE